MGRISRKFEEVKRDGRIALMPYLAVGYPTIEATLDLAKALVEVGSDVFELGVPYSDPLADGATVQRATQVALKNGVTLGVCLEVAERIRAFTDIPLVLMSYFNPIDRYGLEEFSRDAATAGVDGLIVPDLPPEESAELRAASRRHGLNLIFLVAPTSTDERLRLVADVAEGFVYCVALSGVTGARTNLNEGLTDYLDRVRHYIDLPLAVGFGISRAEHVRIVARHADGAIVASALIDRMDSLPEAERIRGAAEFTRELAEATTLS